MPDNNHVEILAPEQEFPILEDPAGILALLDEGLSQGTLPLLDLQRIRVPSGGGLAFRYDTAAGEETAKKLTGVIVAYRNARIFWRTRAAGKKPPDCTSIDGFIGVGDPGGPCAKCPNAQFGSAIRPDGTPSGGQACKDLRQVLFLMPGEMLPHLLSVPPTSVKAFSQYTLTLLSARTHYWGAVTEITLEKTQSADAIDYARINFRLGKRLDKNALPVFQPFHERMKAVLKPAIVDASAYEIAGGDEEHLVSQPRKRIPPPVVQQREPGDDEPGDSDIPF